MKYFAQLAGFSNLPARSFGGNSHPNSNIIGDCIYVKTHLNHPILEKDKKFKENLDKIPSNVPVIIEDEKLYEFENIGPIGQHNIPWEYSYQFGDLSLISDKISKRNDRIIEILNSYCQTLGRKVYIYSRSFDAHYWAPLLFKSNNANYDRWIECQKTWADRISPYIDGPLIAGQFFHYSPDPKRQTELLKQWQDSILGRLNLAKKFYPGCKTTYHHWPRFHDSSEKRYQFPSQEIVDGRLAVGFDNFDQIFYWDNGGGSFIFDPMEYNWRQFIRIAKAKQRTNSHNTVNVLSTPQVFVPPKPILTNINISDKNGTI